MIRRVRINDVIKNISRTLFNSEFHFKNVLDTNKINEETKLYRESKINITQNLNF